MQGEQTAAVEEVEEWRRPLEYHPYRIGSLGHIKGKTGHILSQVLDLGGYPHSSVRVNGEQKDVFDHIMIARTYIPNPDNKEFVNHINGIRTDNRVVNLEWATVEENNNRKVFPNPTPEKNNLQKGVVQMTLAGVFIRGWDSINEAAAGTPATRTGISLCCRGEQKTSGKFRWKFAEAVPEIIIPGEEWREGVIDGYKYQASSEGRIRLASGILAKGTLARGYLVCAGDSFLMHRMIALAWIPNPEGRTWVNHIDGDKTNNVLSNLEWSWPKENAQHAVKIGLTKNTNYYKRAVRQLTKAGKLVAIHDSIAEGAAKVTKATPANIGECCRGKRKTAGGFKWQFVVPDDRCEEIEAIPVPRKVGPKVANRSKIPVHQLTLDGEFIKEHASFSEAEEETGCSGSSISMCCRGIKYNRVGKFKWRFARPGVELDEESGMDETTSASSNTSCESSSSSSCESSSSSSCESSSSSTSSSSSSSTSSVYAEDDPIWADYGFSVPAASSVYAEDDPIWADYGF